MPFWLFRNCDFDEATEFVNRGNREQVELDDFIPVEAIPKHTMCTMAVRGTILKARPFACGITSKACAMSGLLVIQSLNGVVGGKNVY